MPSDNLEVKIKTATSELLVEQGLSETTHVDDIQRQVDSSRIDVGLAQMTGNSIKFHRFVVQPEEALKAQGGAAITVESLKPFVRRELEKLFRN